MSGTSEIPTYQPSRHTFTEWVTDNINREEFWPRVYRAEDNTNAVGMFTQLKRDGHKKLRFLRHCRPWNAVTIQHHTTIRNIVQAIEFVVARPRWSKIDLTDGYNNIHIDPCSAKQTTRKCHMWDYRSLVILGGDGNATATMGPAMHAICLHMIYKDLIIHIKDIISLRSRYQEWVTRLRPVLPRPQDQQFWSKWHKCQFISKPLEIQEHSLTSKRLSVDREKVRKIFDPPEHKDEQQLQAFIVIGNYLSTFILHMVRVAACLPHLQSTTHPSWLPDRYFEAFQQCKDLIKSGEVMTSCTSTSMEHKDVVCDTCYIGLCSWLERQTHDFIQLARFHYCEFNPAWLNDHSLQKEVLATIQSLNAILAQLLLTKLIILTDRQPIEKFFNCTQLRQKLCRW